MRSNKRYPCGCPTPAGNLAGMNEFSLDLELCAPWLARRPRRPGPVGRFFAAEVRGTLFLRWSPPRGSRVESYLIERTRDGRKYERVAEICQTQCLLPRPPLGEAWSPLPVRAFGRSQTETSITRKTAEAIPSPSGRG